MKNKKIGRPQTLPKNQLVALRLSVVHTEKIKAKFNLSEFIRAAVEEHMKKLGLLIALVFIASCGKDATVICNSGEKMEASNGKETILVVGDSISIAYDDIMQETLTDHQVIHNPCNAMETTWTLSEIDGWLGQRDRFAAITFNNGLWDIAPWVRTPESVYRHNIRQIALKIKAKTDAPLFILTTKVPDNANDGRSDVNAQRLNQIAQEVMAELGIPVVDLYTKSDGLERVTPDDVHFTDAASRVLGQEILDQLLFAHGIGG